jgi:flagellar motor switch protein FliN/FliY
MSSQNPAIELISREFSEAFSSVFSQTCGEPYPLEACAGEAAEAAGLQYTLAVAGAMQGKLSFQVDLDGAAILATRLMGMPVEGDVSYVPEHEDAVFEIVSQTAGLMATAFRTRFGDATINAERTQEPADGTATLIALQAAGGSKPVLIELRCDQALLQSLAQCLAPQEAAPNSAGRAPSEAPSIATERNNMQLIMDVELSLTLRFGQKTLALSEIADLATGSVIELDRVVDEPVELLLGERVIARGEVVIVDGNYGLRIVELAAIDQSTLLSA